MRPWERPVAREHRLTLRVHIEGIAQPLRDPRREDRPLGTGVKQRVDGDGQFAGLAQLAVDGEDEPVFSLLQEGEVLRSALVALLQPQSRGFAW
jgi:hypothetical protein